MPTLGTLTTPETLTGQRLGASRIIYKNEATNLGQEFIPYTNAGFVIVNLTAAATLTDTSPLLVRCDTTSGAFTVTLPPTSKAYNGFFHIVKVDSAANSVTIAIDSTDTWYGSTTPQTLASQWKSVTLIAAFDAISSISGWHVVAST